MATTPLEGTPSPVTFPNQFPPVAAAHIAGQLLNRHSPHEIAEAVEVLLDVLNLMGGDPDAEDDDPDEVAGDEGDVAWIEWQNTHPGKRTHNYAGSEHEDAEEDDPPGQCDEDEVNTELRVLRQDYGPGCTISDPDYCNAGEDRITGGHVVNPAAFSADQGAGDPEDAEREGLHDDVPMLPVFSLDHNMFSDLRQPLGFSNMQSSFRTNGQDVRSADSGKPTAQIIRWITSPVCLCEMVVARLGKVGR
jgi:hypothetical protein